jgi:hypothetical protein
VSSQIVAFPRAKYGISSMGIAAQMHNFIRVVF